MAPFPSKRLIQKLSGTMCAFAVGLTLIFTSVEPASADDVTPDAANYTFLTFNMCGHSCTGTSSNSKADAVAQSINTHRPLVATLQEVCLNELQRIYSDLQGMGLAYGYDFMQTIPGTLDDGCKYGIATVNTGHKDPTYTQTFNLSNPYNLEPRGLLCILLRDPETIRVCDTHMTSGDTQNQYQTRLVQAADIREDTNPFLDRGTRTILAGDFNAKPTSPVMDNFYTPNYGGSSFGRYYEVDGCCTKGGFITDPGKQEKLDYIFHSNLFTTVDYNVTLSSYSDHNLLIGVVRNA